MNRPTDIVLLVASMLAFGGVSVTAWFVFDSNGNGDSNGTGRRDPGNEDSPTAGRSSPLTTPTVLTRQRLEQGAPGIPARKGQQPGHTGAFYLWVAPQACEDIPHELNPLLRLGIARFR